MVIDSSTLILLAKAGLLDKLLNRVKAITISTKVEQESTEGKDTFDAMIIKKRIGEGRILVKRIKNSDFYNRLRNDFNLGEGEAEAIALAKEEDVLLTDDRKAINTCRIFNIEFATALNILVELFHQKELSKDESKAILRKLAEYGRYSDELIEKTKGELK